MQVPEIPENEAARLAALEAYNVLDTLPESDFDDITYIASQICETPVALISLVDETRQWFKSRVGLDASETARELAFCAHAINKPDELLVVPDSAKDIRFADNPLVTGGPHVAFYAGAPLVSPEGHPLGTLCVIDHEPRELSEAQQKSLAALSNQVVSQLELRKKVGELEQHQRELKLANEDLTRFAHIASHDLKTPLRGMISVIDWIHNDFGETVSDELKQYLDILRERSDFMQSLVSGILDYSSAASKKLDPDERVSVQEVLKDIQMAIEVPDGVELRLPANADIRIAANQVPLTQVLQNLVSNAIKYNHKQKGGLVELRIEDEPKHVRISVVDNGPGIDKKYHGKIFEVFETLGTNDRFGEKGSGIGLATAKRLVERMQGSIYLESVHGDGCAFHLTFGK